MCVCFRGMAHCFFLTVVIRSPTEGSRVEEEHFLSTFSVDYKLLFRCVILCRSFTLTGKMLSTLYSIIKF